MNKYLFARVGPLVCCAALAFTTPLSAQERQAPDAPRSDNTAVNEGDSRRDAVTPMSQSNSEQALRITSEIRSSLVEDDSLSTYARNVKIITDDAGKVTLRGPVRTEAERQKIEQVARQVAGNSNVQSQMTIAENR